MIENEDNVVHSLSLHLKDAGYTVIVAKDSAGGLALHARERPDLLILDIMLPGIDGFEICRRIRVWSTTPIVILTARSDEEDCINGLEMGADDYLVKPFSPSELISRVRAVLRRVGNGEARTYGALLPASATEETASVLCFPGLTIDLLARQVEVRGRKVTLTPTEFDLLALLAKSPDHVFTRKALMNQVRGYDCLGDGHAIDVHISALRKKIDIDPQHRFIKTVWRVGYCFEVKTC
jgi:two-component system response regulator ResD